jgi:hypothetical protein
MVPAVKDCHDKGQEGARARESEMAGKCAGKVTRFRQNAQTGAQGLEQAQWPCFAGAAARAVTVDKLGQFIPFTGKQQKLLAIIEDKAGFPQAANSC